MKKSKRKLTAAESKARRERRKKYITVFINGKQKRVPRPQLIEGLPVEESIRQNADSIWLHQMDYWELLTGEDTDPTISERRDAIHPDAKRFDQIDVPF